jgi:hypothetical protein
MRRKWEFKMEVLKCGCPGRICYFEPTLIKKKLTYGIFLQGLDVNCIFGIIF